MYNINVISYYFSYFCDFNACSNSAPAFAGKILDVVTSALLYLCVEPWHDPT